MDTEGHTHSFCQVSQADGTVLCCLDSGIRKTRTRTGVGQHLLGGIYPLCAQLACSLLGEVLPITSAHYKLAGSVPLDSKPAPNLQQRGRVSQRKTYLESFFLLTCGLPVIRTGHSFISDALLGHSSKAYQSRQLEKCFLVPLHWLHSISCLFTANLQPVIS